MEGARTTRRSCQSRAWRRCLALYLRFASWTRHRSAFRVSDSTSTSAQAADRRARMCAAALAVRSFGSTGARLLAAALRALTRSCSSMAFHFPVTELANSSTGVAPSTQPFRSRMSQSSPSGAGTSMARSSPAMTTGIS